MGLNSESVTYVRIEREVDDPWSEFIIRSRNLVSFWKKSLIFEVVGNVGVLLFLYRLLDPQQSSNSSSIPDLLKTLLLMVAMVWAIASIVILVMGIVKVITTFLCINRALDQYPDVKARCLLSECRASLIGVASSTIICSLAGCSIAGYLVPLALKFCYYKTCKEIIP
ncbi:hypothetical protein HF1_02740 [Mycoplasma haemofelis str. Langford 1]|uniref:Uncharacterized protein n=1 Tax=Mycoplasma haemofelis (strain Langford 1) TaxID=941640 RepID=E8ZGL1_MYCHL|nr:hypothetical protein [Mycoplasma haemofelis]CBY92282.1 hypothetical protein HF1_02740 [Mycoplasma haemofelis str. Langford 1]